MTKPKKWIPIEDLPNEIWLPLVGFETLYKVSNMGRIKNKNHQLLSTRERRSYLAASLTANSISHDMPIHRAVALTFIPNPFNRYCVNHINGKKFDNRVENLEWVSARENTCHALDKTKTTSKYTGVIQRKDTLKWRAYINPYGKNIWLGQFNTEEEACEAYKEALEQFKFNNKYISL
jgi:hypothetical protein